MINFWLNACGLAGIVDVPNTEEDGGVVGSVQD